jgi:hypothetical protein
MSTSGAMFLGTNTGSSISVYGQALLTYYFGSGSSTASISIANLNSMTSAVSAANSGHIGDTMIAVVTETTNGFVYRITGQQNTTSQSGNYNIIIEQIG